MKVLVVLAAVVLAAAAMPGQAGHGARAPAKPCDPEDCVAPKCRCAGTDIPGDLAKEDTPQFVILTFDDAVTPLNILDYRKALYKRKNPNGCAVAATYFVSHEYTDYSLVHELHANGMEIALHSITHQPMTAYWKNATVDTLLKEFAGERELIANFAKIPEEDIKGIRMPFLQMAGNNQYTMLNQAGFVYDVSWTTQKYIQPGLWPYTTEYVSSQECLIGPCPNESIPNVWVIPMINWKDRSDVSCSMVDACTDIPEDVEGLKKWMIGEFEKQYKGNRAPFGFYVHAAWFLVNDNHLPAYIAFLDYLQTLPDVFLASGSQVIEWVQNPIPISEMKPDSDKVECQETYTPTCSPRACQLKLGTVERWMTSCASVCPKSYPWLGNPLGTA